MMEFPESEPLLSKAESFATGHSLLVTPKSTWYGLLNRFLLAHQQEKLSSAIKPKKALFLS